MAKSNNQKAKILYLEQMLRETGENRVVTMQEILARLTEYGISAERKSIYDDIEALRSFGMDVKFRRGRPGGYYLAGQTAPEKPAAAAFIAEKEQSEEKLVLEEKTGAEGKDVAEKEEAAEGKVVRKPAGADFKFRKDASFDDHKQMKLLCDNARQKEVKAYFGKSAQYREKGLGYFTVTAQLLEGPQFYGWLTAMGREVRILKPKKTAQGYREYLKALVKEYKGI